MTEQTWEDRMAARTRARGRHHEQVQNRAQQAISDEYERVHGARHRHLEGTAVYCSCGEFHGLTCVALPPEWAAMTREQIRADVDAWSCDICGKHGVTRLGG